MDLKSVLSENQIIYTLNSNTKEALFKELLDLLYQAGKIKDKSLALNGLLLRESKLSTGMENGLAVPHAKTEAVEDLVIAFGLHHTGISYGTLDEKPVHFVFMVLSPPDTSGPHIKALASIARSLKDGNVRDAIRKCNSKKEIYRILTQ